MFQIRKAERRQAKLRLALTGVSGCGKTLGSIHIAKGMGGRFIIIDTEHKSADLYADRAEYDVLTLDKPFTPDRYIDAIHQCELAGYDIIIIDSLSHAWAGEGGVLDMHDAITNASSSKNSYMAWGKVTPLQNKLVNTIIQSKCHIITTLRSKTHHDIVDLNGRKCPVKIGLAPIQRDGLEYEFTTVLNIDKDSHFYSSSKDRTGIFEGNHEKVSIDTGKRLMAWLQSGKSIEEVENEEIHIFTTDLTNCETLDSLRSTFKIAKDKYPLHESAFLKIANERSQLIKSTLEVMS